MIDSPCPWATADWKSKRPKPQFRETTSEKNKELITKSFDHCRAMISTYQKPTSWQPPPTAMIKAEESSIRNVDAGLEEDGVIGWSVYQELRISPVEVVAGDHFSMFEEDRVSIPTKDQTFLTVEQLDDVTERIRDVLRTFH